MKTRVVGKWLASVVITGAAFASALGISGPAAPWLNGYYHPVEAQASSQPTRSACPVGWRCCGVIIGGVCSDQCIPRGASCP